MSAFTQIRSHMCVELMDVVSVSDSEANSLFTGESIRGTESRGTMPIRRLERKKSSPE